jgi:hypothetical protein
MLESVVSQGVSILNFYIVYGGTNWGTIGIGFYLFKIPYH